MSIASKFFSAGLATVNTAFKAADVAEAGARAAKHYGTKAAKTTATTTKVAGIEVTECAGSFWDGVRAGWELNRSLSK